MKTSLGEIANRKVPTFLELEHGRTDLLGVLECLLGRMGPRLTPATLRQDDCFETARKRPKLQPDGNLTFQLARLGPLLTEKELDEPHRSPSAGRTAGGVGWTTF